MGSAWKFVGVFKRGRKEPLYLECVVAVSDPKKAESIAKKRLIGADEVTATELTQPELRALALENGEDVIL